MAPESTITLIPPIKDGTCVAIVELAPRGRDFGVKVCRGKNTRHTSISEFAGYTCADTGEVLHDPIMFARDTWARRICGRFGGWPLIDLIDALPIDGIGRSTAECIARAMGSWERFMEALTQLKGIDVPETRDALDAMMGERFWRTGRLGEFIPGDVSQAYPEPLASLMRPGVTGPTIWKRLKQWVESKDAKQNIEALLKYGDPIHSAARAYPLSGREISFIGTLEGMTRVEARNLAERLGARVVSIPTSKTDIVVVGTGPSASKLNAAERVGAKLLAERDWLDLVETCKG